MSGSITFPGRWRQSRNRAPGPNRIGHIGASDDPSAIEVVRGHLDSGRAEEVLRFWSERRALPEPEARRRLPEVVCLLRSGGMVVGASSVYPADVALIGGRRFWIYRSLVDQAVADRAPAMIRATFSALEAEFDGSPHAPIGLCVLLADAEERGRRPQAEWPDPRMLYAGYLADGSQVRIAYFAGARIAWDEPRA